MNVRNLTFNDTECIKRIYDEYFSNDFQFPDFFNGFFNSFAITNDKNEIVVVGGIKLLAEAVILTDGSKNIHNRVRALREALSVCIYTCNKLGVGELFAFAKDDKYIKHLQTYGFNLCYTALSIKV